MLATALPFPHEDIRTSGIKATKALGKVNYMPPLFILMTPLSFALTQRVKRRHKKEKAF